MKNQKAIFPRPIYEEQHWEPEKVDDTTREYPDTATVFLRILGLSTLQGLSEATGWPMRACQNLRANMVSLRTVKRYARLVGGSDIKLVVTTDAGEEYVVKLRS